MANKWTENEIPDLSGKVVIITGANSGLGFENVKQFAKKGATTILACRNMSKGSNALEKLKKEIPNGIIELLELDLGNLASIRKFVSEFKEKYDRLDILLNNAGIMMVPYQKTTDGFESQVGINHLGHFALTSLLYDHLLATKGSRVVNVSSSAHTSGKMDFDNFLYDNGNDYSRMGAYGRSKLSNLLFTYEMDRRLKENQIDILAVASHPGISSTNLANDLMGWFTPLFKYTVGLLLFQSAAKGALPSSRAAVDPSVKGGEYYGPRGFLGVEMRGFPNIVKSNNRSHNLEDAKRLWELSEELTGIKFDI